MSDRVANARDEDLWFLSLKWYGESWSCSVSSDSFFPVVSAVQNSIKTIHVPKQKTSLFRNGDKETFLWFMILYELVIAEFSVTLAWWCSLSN